MADLLERLSLDSKTGENGVYKLVPIESLIINKNLPYGIRLELEERYEQKRTIFDKKELTEGIFINNNNKIYILPDQIKWAQKLKFNLLSKKRSRAKTITFSTIGLKKLKYKGKKIPNMKDLLDLRCKYVFYSLILSRNFDLYYNAIKNLEDTDINLMMIKEKIMSSQYINLKEFKQDFRNLWSKYYSKFEPNQELLCKTSVFCRISENLLEEITQMNKDDCNKKIDELKLKIKDNKKIKYILEEFNDVNKEINDNNDISEINEKNINIEKKNGNILDYKIDSKNPLSSSLDKIIKNINKQNSDNSLTSNYLFKDSKRKESEKEEYDEKIFLCNCINNFNQEQILGLFSVLNISNNKNDSFIELDINELSPEKYKKLKEYIFNCLKEEENKLYNLGEKLFSFRENSSLKKKDDSISPNLDSNSIKNNKPSLINEENNNINNSKNSNKIEKKNIYNKNIYNNNIFSYLGRSNEDKIENKYYNQKSDEGNIPNNFLKQKNNDIKNMLYNPQNNIFQNGMISPISPNSYFQNISEDNINNVNNFNNSAYLNKFNDKKIFNQNITNFDNNFNNKAFIPIFFDSISPISPIQKNAFFIESPNNNIISPISGLLSPIINNNVVFPFDPKKPKESNKTNNYNNMINYNNNELNYLSNNGKNESKSDFKSSINSNISNNKNKKE